MDLLDKLPLTSSIFWLGIFGGIFFAWLLYRLRKLIPGFFKTLRQKISSFREIFTTSGELQLRNEIFQFAQKQHIASSLFPLDDIAIEPKIMLPLIQPPKSLEFAPTDSVSLTVPYTPDWPELAALYRAPTLGLVESLQGGANIVLAGHPGSGKSVALAWLASKIASNQKQLGTLSGLLPIYIHATDIPNLTETLPQKISYSDNADLTSSPLIEKPEISRQMKANEVIDMIIQAISRYVSPLTITRLARIITSAIENHRVVFLIDRVDELPTHQAHIITEYIKTFLEKYPKIRFVVAVSYNDFAGLPALGFSQLGMAAWGGEDRADLLQRWSQHWNKAFPASEKTQTKKVNAHFLNNWLQTDHAILQPIEYTLKIWAAFSGDILGKDGSSAVEAYIRRLACDDLEKRKGLELFALQLLFEANIASDPSNVDRLISAYIAESEIESKEDSTDQDNKALSSQINIPTLHPVTAFESYTSTGILINYPGSRYGFSHPIIAGYLASKALSESGILKQILFQPSWTGKNLALYYLSRYVDVSPLVHHFLEDDNALHTNHLLISRWLQIAPKTRVWRTIILRTLTIVLQKENETLSLAAKVVSALALSGDAGVSVYFRQLLKSSHPNLRQLAALGCGILRDKNAIEELALIFQEQSPASIRSASLALAAIGEKRALEILASALLSGDETTRRYAAEALANNSSEGHPALKEASGMEDLLVRRAVVYGLIRINRPWAYKIVENLQLEDTEWVVRNAAIEAFDELKHKSTYVPTFEIDLTETPWLVDYANRIGTTVAPGKLAEQLVAKALSNGNKDEKLFAMEYYRNMCTPENIDQIYAIYSNSSGELKDMAYHILWLGLLTGIRLPTAIEF